MKRNKTMKNFMRLNYLIFTCALLLIMENTYAQSPYAISPKWFFGRQGGMDFSGGAPVVMLGGKVDGSGQEDASTMCDPSGNVLFYSDSYNLYDGTNTFVQNVNGGTSSTCSSVSFPDPSNPTTQFYFVTANQDPGGGGTFAATLGIYYYLIKKTGPGTISVLSGPNMLATNGQVTEQLCAGSDGNGGYWVVTHQGGGANGNQIWSWNFTAAGVGTKQISAVAGTENNISYNGSMKINKCQNKLAAIYKTGKVEVFNWSQTTGTVSSAIICPTTVSFGYGCEFSPDGNVLYFTDLVGNQLYQWDLIANIATPLAGGTSSNNVTEMGTLQLGPDDKIYVTNVGNYGTPAYIGVVNNPNVVGAGCNYNRTGFLLNAGPGFTPNIYRGIANEAWINPTLSIDTLGACKILKFSYNFLTYFGSTVAVTAGSEQWDFGDGGGLQSGLGATPTHTYAAGGSYTITMKVTDATCGNTFTVSRNITVNNCSVPPPGCTSNITAAINPVTDVALNQVNSVTVNFNGSTSAFDGANRAPHQYYWSVGTPDTTIGVFSTTNTSSLTFQYNGNGGNHPQGSYNVYLIIRQGFCMDTVSIHLNATYTLPVTTCINGIQANIQAVKEIMIDDVNPVTVSFSGTASIFDPSVSAPDKYFWSLGSPDTINVLSTNPETMLSFAYKGKGGNYPQGSYDIYLVIKQGYCIDTVKTHLDVTHFYIPNLVTPNGDDKNDRFEITNTSGRFDVEVYNRWGERIFKEKGYTNGWDLGNVSDGVYYFNIIDAESAQNYKGWVQVMR
jgi:gliding motility-associated-like protein